MTHHMDITESSYEHSSEMHTIGELMNHLESAITESDLAISSMVDSFLTIASAASTLAHSDTLSQSDREVSNLIQREIAVTVSSLQFQDLLKQRLQFIKTGLETLTQAGVGQNVTLGSHLSSDVKTAFVNHDDGEITLFLEAA